MIKQKMKQEQVTELINIYSRKDLDSREKQSILFSNDFGYDSVKRFAEIKIVSVLIMQILKKADLI